MTRVVINRCYGGFGLSDAAVERYAELKGIKLVKQKEKAYGDSAYWIDGIEDDEHYFSAYSLYDRDYRIDPVVIQVVEELGKEANGFCADLRIVEVPDDVEWFIAENDGIEWIAEEHRTWS